MKVIVIVGKSKYANSTLSKGIECLESSERFVFNEWTREYQPTTSVVVMGCSKDKSLGVSMKNYLLKREVEDSEVVLLESGNIKNSFDQLQKYLSQTFQYGDVSIILVAPAAIYHRVYVLSISSLSNKYPVEYVKCGDEPSQEKLEEEKDKVFNFVDDIV